MKFFRQKVQDERIVIKCPRCKGTGWINKIGCITNEFGEIVSVVDKITCSLCRGLGSGLVPKKLLEHNK